MIILMEHEKDTKMLHISECSSPSFLYVIYINFNNY